MSHLFLLLNYPDFFFLVTEKRAMLFQVMEFLKKMAGMENVGFSNAT